MKESKSVWIVAPPGPLRVGLRAALQAMGPLETVGEADTAMHVGDVNHDPALVLLSIEAAGNGSLAAIRLIKARWPAVPCIVLVDTVAQQRAVKAAGAEEVLIKGVPAKVLMASIERLLRDNSPIASKADALDTLGS